MRLRCCGTGDYRSWRIATSRDSFGGADGDGKKSGGNAAGDGARQVRRIDQAVGGIPVDGRDPFGGESPAFGAEERIGNRDVVGAFAEGLMKGHEYGIPVRREIFRRTPSAGFAARRRRGSGSAAPV